MSIISPIPASPRSVANLGAWYRADSLLALADGAQVATWTDKSRYGRDVSQATAGQRPLYKVNQVNGRPVVRFDGINDQLGGLNVDFGNAYTFYIVLKLAALATDVGFIGGPTGTTEVLAFHELGPNLFYNKTANITMPYSTGAFFIAEIWRDPTNVKFYKNAAQQGATQSISSGLTSLFGCIGNVYQDNTTSWLNGDIAEIALYHASLSAVSRGRVLKYFSVRYGIAI